ncbi:hypothetical protein COMX_06715 [Commensalibacter papalotli (ex Servin-Garciduenas et al. 2014)]|uniref:Uncharacterized protein n=1 Tax=Commensalibacter papalotli (ex Servin-Garciduenas et al. 2014) TaxID=1208583 RepID=W7DZE8_9PROT|nr:hypothetical protein COMX_06715 [Commensalibacter papalotli (ex Servin-Garciduenas et al. 2014)]
MGKDASFHSTIGDVSLFGNTLNHSGNVALSSAVNVGLNSVANSGFSNIKGHKSGSFNSSSFENKSGYTIKVGSTITSNRLRRGRSIRSRFFNKCK